MRCPALTPAFVFGACLALAGSQAASATTAVSSVLDQFTAPGIPVLGPSEAGPTARTWTEPPALPSLPGNGLAQHPMLYAGEGFNTVFLVNQGRVVWSYSTGKGGEIDDVWLLSNGHILFTRQFHILEVTPQKQVVWQYDAPIINGIQTEVHTCQPIGLDKVLFVQNGLPPQLIILNKKTGVVEVQHALPAESATDKKTVHPQFRRIRMTAAGTYLASFLKMAQVVEFDKDFNPIWTYKIPTPWAALRLKNGNTLIADEHDTLIREVNPQGATVWELKPSDMPPGIVLRHVQTMDRLANGDTVVYNTGRSKTPEGTLQVIEVTPDKKVVWALQDWKDLGPSTTAQFLDEPGVPENPGDLQH